MSRPLLAMPPRSYGPIVEGSSSVTGSGAPIVHHGGTRLEGDLAHDLARLMAADVLT
jgi:hypothetical protein